MYTCPASVFFIIIVWASMNILCYPPLLCWNRGAKKEIQTACVTEAVNCWTGKTHLTGSGVVAFKWKHCRNTHAETRMAPRGLILWALPAWNWDFLLRPECLCWTVVKVLCRFQSCNCFNESLASCRSVVWFVQILADRPESMPNRYIKLR